MTSTRPCAACGGPFEASRRDARYCSPSCRKRASRASVTPSALVDRSPVDVVGAVTRELAAVGADGTASGQAAILLARHLQDMPATMGSAIAAVSKELRAAMAAAIQAAPRDRAGDPITALQRARLSRMQKEGRTPGA